MAETAETIRCAKCKRECEPVNDADQPVTECVDCAPSRSGRPAGTPSADPETIDSDALRKIADSLERVDWSGGAVGQAIIDCAADYIDQLRAALTASRSDAARLDWLQMSCEDVDVVISGLVPNSDPAVYWVASGHTQADGHSLREAIDAARGPAT